MSQRSQELAERFIAANEELIQCIEGCSEEALDCITADEEWPVRVTAHHIAVSHEPVAALAQMIADGQPLPTLTLKIFDEGNAKHAAEHATVSKKVIVDKLKESGAKAGEIIRALSDEALDRSSYFTLFEGDVTAEEIVENMLIGHVSGHTQSIKAAVGK